MEKGEGEEKSRFIDISKYILFMPVPHANSSKMFLNKASFLNPASHTPPHVSEHPL